MVLNEKTLKFPKKLRTQHSQKIDRWFLFRVNFWVEIRTTVKIRTIDRFFESAGFLIFLEI